MNEFLLKSPDETEKKGLEIGGQLESGSIVALTGDLGSGKTTIIKAICKGLGVTEEVTSPTFTIMHLYEGKSPVLHLDCYRLKSADEAYFLGIDEYFDSAHICLIEWADLIEEALPEDTVFLRMSRVDRKENERKLLIEGM